MKIHQKILQWQADHPAITWVTWGIIWLVVFILLFQSRAAGGV